MSKVYILRVYDSIAEEEWIGGVYATEELAYKEAMENAKKYNVPDGLHFIEKESTSDYILFAENDDLKTCCDYVEYVIDEWDVKEELDGRS